jgi:pilus assembly protein Flp/PilA
MELNMFTNLSLKAYLLCKRLRSDTAGATMVEYSILIGLITAAVIVAIGDIGTSVDTAWDTLNAAF